MPRFVRTQEIEHPIGADGLLELQVTSANVRLQPSEDDRARVRATFQVRAGSQQEADRTYEEIQLHVDAASRALRVSEPEGGSSLRGTLQRLISGDRAKLDLTVEMPPAAELRLTTVSGDVQGSGLRGTQRYATVSGDLYLLDLGGEISVNTVSGDTTIRGAQALSARAEAVSGDLAIAAPMLRELHSSSVSGDISLEGELSRSGTFRAETVSGDLSVELRGDAVFEVRGIATEINSQIDHRIEGRLDRRRVVIGGGGPEFVFSSMSGDLRIRRAGRVEQATAGDAEPRPAASEVDELAILRALERGEIDVDEATRRLGRERSDA